MEIPLFWWNDTYMYIFIYTFYIHYIWTIAYVPPHLNDGPAWAIQVKQCSNIREYKGTLDLGQMCSIWEAVTTYDHIVGPTKTFALRWNLYILHVVVLQISGYIACFKNNMKSISFNDYNLLWDNYELMTFETLYQSDEDQRGMTWPTKRPPFWLTNLN